MLLQEGESSIQGWKIILLYLLSVHNVFAFMHLVVYDSFIL